jgi:hypothetical protein
VQTTQDLRKPLGAPKEGAQIIDVSIQADRFVFEVKELDQLWSLQSRFEIPIAHIKAAYADPQAAEGLINAAVSAGRL